MNHKFRKNVEDIIVENLEKEKSKTKNLSEATRLEQPVSSLQS